LKILVLGLGNDLYGDDGVGHHVVRFLENKKAARRVPPDADVTVDFIACALSGLALLDVVVGYDALVIVDTILHSDPVIGQIRILDMQDVRDVPGPSPHYISVPQTLALGRSLGLKMPETVKIVAVEARNIHRLGEGLSETMLRRLPDIIAAADGVLEAIAGAIANSASQIS
jgi:hydrogenase maturation protease